MGKVHCHVCGKKCKGDVLKLQDRYFHADCFKCKVCKTELANTGFFVKDADYYCADDYQKSFGTRCATCGDFVEGEVVTALGATFHQGCFKCYDCGKAFDPGDKVTYNGKKYFCRPCATKLGAPSPGSSDGSHTVFEHVSGPGRTSTPVKKMENGNLEKNGNLRNDVSGIATHNDSGLDHTTEELITPSDNQYQHRSPSPSSSAESHSSGSIGRRRHESGPYEPKFEYDYGRMYPASYLKHQTYTVQDGDTRTPHKYQRSQSPGQRHPPKSPHFHRPENFSYTKVKQGYINPMKKGGTPMRERDLRHKSVHSASEDEVDADDPKIEKEIREISKMASKSGMGQVILRDLEEAKKKRSVSPVLDPWSASRTPSAKKEPFYRTRYESPIFASPSRDMDRPRVVQDDSQVHNRSAMLLQYSVAKPGYTYGLAAKSASLPGSARAGVDLNDYADGERRRPVHSYSHSFSLSDVENSRDVLYYSQGGRYQGSHYTEVLNHAPIKRFNKLRRSIPDIITPKKFYTYDQLKDTNNLPKDVDRAKLEFYLFPEEFEQVFGMTKGEFFRQAEWRRVDIKTRLCLNVV